MPSLTRLDPVVSHDAVRVNNRVRCKQRDERRDQQGSVDPVHQQHLEEGKTDRKEEGAEARGTVKLMYDGGDRSTSDADEDPSEVIAGGASAKIRHTTEFIHRQRRKQLPQG